MATPSHETDNQIGWDLCIDALLFTTSLAEAARKAKCNRNTIYHRLKNPEFRDQLSAARKQVREGTISLCLGLMKEYCDSCRKDMKHKNAKTRREAREQVIKTFLGSLDRDALFQKFSAWLERQEQQGK